MMVIVMRGLETETEVGFMIEIMMGMLRMTQYLALAWVGAVVEVEERTSTHLLG